MNNRFLGNGPSLTKYDLLIYLATSFNLPVWYISMITEPEIRNKGDRNATNYRLGSKNAPLLDLMKSIFYGEETSINEITDFLRKNKIKLKQISQRNNLKAENYRIGNITFFNHKERNTYIEGVIALIDKSLNQLIFIDPDNGIIPSDKKLPGSKGSAFMTSLELKYIIDNVTDQSIIMIQQSLTNHAYTHEDRVKDLQKAIQSNITLLVDEVSQSGVYFFAKDEGMHDNITSTLQDYIKSYQFVKSNERVMLVLGTIKGIVIHRPGTISTTGHK